MILKVFSSLADAMILWKAQTTQKSQWYDTNTKKQVEFSAELCSFILSLPLEGQHERLNL